MPERLRNLTAHQPCHHCLDDAVIEVVTRMDTSIDRKGVVHRHGPYPEMAPCPHCERGQLLEFPREKVGPWGRDGYWRGREVPA